MTVEQSVEVGTKIIWRLLLAALVLWFLYLVRDVVILILLSVLTAAALSPAIRRLRFWFKISRTSAVIITYSTVFAGLVALLLSFIPIFLDEVKQFVADWPTYVERLGGALVFLEETLRPLGIRFEREVILRELENNVTGGIGSIFSTTASVFSGLITFIGFFFLAFYLSLEEKGIEKFFLLVTPRRYHAYALSIAERIQGKVSHWLFAQIILMFLIFVLYYIGLSLLGVPYALALAVFGGLMEIIPYIGAIIAGIPAVILGFYVSPVLGFSVLAFYIIAQQIEGNILAPQIIKRSVGLNPVALIIAVLVGAKLGGIMGVLLCIVTVMILSVFVEDFMQKKHASETETV